MTSDLKTQVRDYTQFFVSTVEPVELDEIIERTVGEGLVRPIGPPVSNRQRGWLAAVAAAAVVVIVVGGVAWLARIDGGVPPVQEPSVTTTLPQQAPAIETPVPTVSPVTTATHAPTTVVTTVAVAPSVPPLDAEWVPLSLDPAVFRPDDVVEDIAVAGSGFVAVGQPSPGSEQPGIAWTSPNGVAWLRHEGAFGSLNGSPGSVLSTGVGLIAWGNSATFDLGEGRTAGQAAIWVSDNGISWTAATLLDDRLPRSGAENGAAPQVSDITEFDGRLVAVGTTCDPARVLTPTEETPFPGCERSFTVWTSHDGLTWSETQRDLSPGSGEPLSVTTVGDGLVAVGNHWLLGENRTPAIWTSPNGNDWVFAQPEALTSGVENGWVRAVVAGGPGVMAVGFVETDSGGISPVWASLDGVAWAVSLEVTGEAREILLVEASGQQIIGLSDGTQSYGFDGQTWIEVDGPLKGQLVTIAGFGGTFIAIGTGRDPVIWAIGP